jgi:hypothetical protein
LGQGENVVRDETQQLASVMKRNDGVEERFNGYIRRALVEKLFRVALLDVEEHHGWYRARSTIVRRMATVFVECVEQGGIKHKEMSRVRADSPADI